MARTVTTIPSRFNPVTHQPTDSVKKRKVAGYARVSTDQEEQQTSYEAQIRHYTSFIQSHAEWEFVKMYADEGISGTSTAHRDGFNQMIEDALAGNIDLIITKSVSRFARNTVDSLTTIRKLKENNVECYFEKENIWTFDGKGELLLTIMASLAQEESRSISENVTWGHRKRMQEGKVFLPYSSFLGYRKGADGSPEIVPEEAEIIRFIYRSFLNGLTTGAIGRELDKRGVKSPAGKDKWYASTVESILKNEKYKGCALLQKNFTVDFLTKKRKVNEGEVPQYFVNESHEAIISPEEFEQVQVEFARRKKIGRQYSGKSIFSAKLVCADCCSFFGSKVWHSNDKFRKVVWQCNGKFKNQCTTPVIEEKELKERFVKAFAEFFQNKEIIIESCELLIEELSSTTVLENKIQRILQERDIIAEEDRELVRQNAELENRPPDYDERYQAIVERYNKKSEELNRLLEKLTERQNKIQAMKTLVQKISETNTIIEEFDDDLWRMTVEKVMVHRGGRLVFIFYDGTEIEE